MPLEESTITFLAKMESGPRLQDMTVEQSRAAFNELCTAIGPKCSAPIATTDLEVPGPESVIPVRIYRPEAAGDGTLPVLFYIHGGGFEMGGIDSYDGWCRYLSAASGYVTVAVDYRLIPEHPYPAAVDDTWAVLGWIQKNIGDHGGDPAIVVVGGDSAGGNLAASLAIRSGVELAGQLLIYPATDWSDDWPSMEEVPHGRMFLTRNTFRWTRERYLGAHVDYQDPFASPIRAMDLGGKAPAIIITAEYDPLRDMGEAYGHKLIAAGVPVSIHRYNGHIHGFVHTAEVTREGYNALSECGRWLANLYSDRNGIGRSSRNSSGPGD